METLRCTHLRRLVEAVEDHSGPGRLGARQVIPDMELQKHLDGTLGFAFNPTVLV